jgi:hypothetical protein
MKPLAYIIALLYGAAGAPALTVGASLVWSAWKTRREKSQ